MAGAVVGGAFLSSFLQVLFDRLASLDVGDFVHGRPLDSKLVGEMKVTLLSINALLNDAEEKQITDLKVKEWLNELKDAIYDAEDLLDEIATKASAPKLESTHQSIINKISSFFVDPTSENKNILNRLKILDEHKYVLNLKEDVSGTPFRKSQTTSLVEESGIYGRQADKEFLIKLLLSDDNDGNNITVVPIVGMPGIGKSTVAQLIYNDDEVNKHFDIKAWVFVSQEFDRVTETTLKAFSFPCDYMDLNHQQIQLKNILNNQRFLIVFDDVWNENYSLWESLRLPFEFGALGSKIIVTTRSKHVAQVMVTGSTYNLKLLTDEDCWFLFAKHAFGKGNYREDSALAKTGRQIVKKCKGLPLAAKALGGLLRSKVDQQDWDRVLRSNIWDFPQNKINFLPSLLISYLCLPSPLKRCFAYCSIFPKNFRFKRGELVQLWMAEDLLLHPERNGSMEEIGVEFFNDLVARSFFQQTRRKKCFIMHDLMLELAKFVSGESSFRLGGNNGNGMSKRTRHLSYSNVDFVGSKIQDVICKTHGLRTFLHAEQSTSSRCLLTNEIVSDLLSRLRNLRVLSFSHSVSLSVLPDSVDSLLHLRYLDLSHTAIVKLPDSTFSLYNLQTLLLSHCGYLTELPVNIGRLINLRLLDINGTPLSMMPLQMGRLKNLQILTSFVVGKRSGSGIQDLKELQLLRGKLSISNLENVVNSKDALEANLRDKSQLNELVLKWSRSYVENSLEVGNVLRQLQPPRTLRRLTIEYYGGTKFPHWLGSHTFSNMEFLCLRDCKYCLLLPPLGQLPFLKYLSIMGIGVTSVGCEFYRTASSGGTTFPSLKVLRFENMLEWEDWLQDSGAAFPRLRELHIKNCPKLIKGLPEHLPSLAKLVISRCQQLVAALPMVPSLSELQLEHCNNVSLMDLPPQLLKLTISGYDALKSLFEGININNSCIEKVNISNCPSLVSCLTGCQATIKSLDVKNCGELLFPLEPCFVSLESLCLTSSCDSLRSFTLGLVPNLNHLSLDGCQNLEDISSSAPLKSLRIISCPNFTTFPRVPVPNLTCLLIDRSGNLTSFPEQMAALLPSLLTLTLWVCPNLESFPEAGRHGA
ncbi:Disease resistance protein [Quillaja saponaria]|uniref:Disease resistance protein n=1 Tax=Quillaja saponaria TaxID=32244 RepID=A0AAD7VNP4_QUISA|nr:Disease resistance protein [Quillaja saponaria]